MLDGEMIKGKISKIEKELSYLNDFKKFSFDELAKDYAMHHAVERMIEVIVNFAIDINQHIIANSPKKDLSFDFKRSFILLSDLGVYPKEFAERISESAGLRNILVHEYTKLDEKMFFNSIKDCLNEYTAYCRYIIDYLKKAP